MHASKRAKSVSKEGSNNGLALDGHIAYNRLFNYAVEIHSFHAFIIFVFCLDCKQSSSLFLPRALQLELQRLTGGGLILLRAHNARSGITSDNHTRTILFHFALHDYIIV
jgi:hypothetical protein